MCSLTEELLVEEQRARAIPVLIHKLQELSEDSGHMGGSGRDRGTVVSLQTMQTAQITRGRLKKKSTQKNPTICYSYTIREVRIQTFKALIFFLKEKAKMISSFSLDMKSILFIPKLNM